MSPSLGLGVLTREYPPFVYGGAGVHVDFLVRELRRRDDVDVHVFATGQPRDGATTFSEDDPRLPGADAALRVLSADVAMAGALGELDVVHSHTWYTALAGHLAALTYGVPHVLTAHSLEPLRPWKAESLGGGYHLSSWMERTSIEAAAAVVAVSEAMRRDILTTYPAVEPARVRVIHNGIDTDFYAPDPSVAVLHRLGVDLDRPYVTFVGRISRQKGVAHLLRAAFALPPEVQLVLAAGAPDSAELAAETSVLVERLRQERTGVVLVEEMLPREDVRALLTHAAVFVCPSVYEPLGIVNLEAMACGTAVVASDVGGIPEVVDHGVTGLLVPYDAADTTSFERGLAEAITSIVGDPHRADAMGRAGRRRTIERFAWAGVAERTVELYRSVLR